MSASISLGLGGKRRKLPFCVTLRNCVNSFGTWNVKGVNWIPRERGEVVDVYRKGRFGMLASAEKKLKGNVGSFVVESE